MTKAIMADKHILKTKTPFVAFINVKQLGL
jgi:hypothetical protein